LSLALVLGLGALACKREAPREDVPFGFDPNAQAERDDPPMLALVEPGAEPRVALRYGERAPDRSVQLAVHNEFSSDELLIELTLAWTGLEPEGETRRYLYDVVAVRQSAEDVLGELEAQVTRKIAEGFDAVAGQATASASGIDQIVQTRGIPTQPSVDGLIRSAAVPLPDEPVGVGAVWETTRSWTETLGGFEDSQEPPQPKPIHEEHTFTETARYTLVAKSGNQLTIQIDSTTTPDDPARAYGSRSKGQVVTTLDDPLPRSGSIDIFVRPVFPGFEEAGERELRSGLRLTTL
jgi:hypothetical protein